MKTITRKHVGRLLPRAAAGALLLCLFSPVMRSEAQDRKVPPDETKGLVPSSYDQFSPVLQGKQTFEEMGERDRGGRADVMARQKKLLEERYALSVKVSDKVKMSRGKPIPVGSATSLPAETSWVDLDRLSP